MVPSSDAVKKELSTLRSGTRAAKFEAITAVLGHVDVIKTRIQIPADRALLDAIVLKRLNPVTAPAPVIGEAAYDLAMIIRNLAPPSVPGQPVDHAMASFITMVTGAEQRAAEEQAKVQSILSRQAAAGVKATGVSSALLAGGGKLRIDLDPARLVVPLPHPSEPRGDGGQQPQCVGPEPCPSCGHNSAMPLMSPEEVASHNAANAAIFAGKVAEWEASGAAVGGRPRRAGKLAPITTPFACQCSRAEGTLCRCSYQFHEEDKASKRRDRRRAQTVLSPSGGGSSSSSGGGAMMMMGSAAKHQLFMLPAHALGVAAGGGGGGGLGGVGSAAGALHPKPLTGPPLAPGFSEDQRSEQAAKRKRAWLEASAARDALIESKEAALTKVEAELAALPSASSSSSGAGGNDDGDGAAAGGGSGSAKRGRLLARRQRLSRELKDLEDDEVFFNTNTQGGGGGGAQPQQPEAPPSSGAGGQAGDPRAMYGPGHAAAI